MKIVQMIFLILLLFIVLALVSACKRKMFSEKKTESYYKSIKSNIQLCSGCKTGKETYISDSKSPFCPYISCYNNGNCKMYKPLK